MKKRFIFLLLLVLLAAVGCARTDDLPDRTVPENTPVIETPIPTPVQETEPVYEPCGTVTVEGKNLEMVLVDGLQCVALQDLTAACPYDVKTQEPYVPVELWCIDNGIGMLTDEKDGHMYCTKAAGTWTYPEGYDVPVMMYHEVQPDDAGGDGDTVKLSEFEKQMKFLSDNGYTPIWFEDLEHIDTITRPILLTFDDGYVGNYLYLLPILQKYNFKATVFLFVDVIYNRSRYLTEEQVVELADSGLVQIGSHTMDHPQLDTISQEEQERQLYESRLAITRLTGRIPYVLCYPYGAETDYIVDEIHKGTYRFGVKMVGLRSFNTSDDCATVWRFWPRRDMSIDEYSSILNSVFPQEQA